MKNFFPLSILICLAGFITGCAQQPPIVQAPSPPHVLKPDHDAIAAIRSAGADFGSAVEVQPLRNPAVEGWLKEAHELEIKGKFEEAMTATQRALSLATGAPDILQYQAELEFQRQRYDESEKLANKSYENGPKVGSLCARNWQTIIEIRSLLEDEPAKAQAEKQLASCKIAQPVRM